MAALLQINRPVELTYILTNIYKVIQPRSRAVRFKVVLILHICIDLFCVLDGSQSGRVSLWVPFQNSASAVTILYKGAALIIYYFQ